MLFMQPVPSDREISGSPVGAAPKDSECCLIIYHDSDFWQNVAKVLTSNLNPSTICHPKIAACNSASAVDRADTVCLDDRQVTMLPPHDTINPLCDFVSAPANPASVQAISSVRSPSTEMRIPW